MRLSPDLPPCELTLPDTPQANLSITQSLSLASFLVDSLYLLCWMGAFLLLASFFLVFFLFAEDSRLIIKNIIPVIVLYIVYRIGVNIIFKKGRARLVSMFLRIIKRFGENPESKVKVSLTAEAIGLQTAETQLTLNWDQVKSILTDENGFGIELVDKPRVYLTRDDLPAAWQDALTDN